MSILFSSLLHRTFVDAKPPAPTHHLFFQFIHRVFFFFVFLSIALSYVVSLKFHLGITETTLLIILSSATFIFVSQSIQNKCNKIIQEYENAIVTQQYLHDKCILLAVHDIRSAGTAVKWGLRVIEPLQSGFDQSQREIFLSIKEKNERTLSLAHHLLLMTQIENGTLVAQPSNIPLHSFLAELISSFDQLAKNKGVTIRSIEISAECEITVDGDILKDILTILLRNAIVHASPSRGIVQISAHIESATLGIKIENDGTGIPLPIQPKIFSKFWMKDGTTEIERSGFGLYLARSLATISGGTLGFISSPGSTIFQLEYKGQQQAPKS